MKYLADFRVWSEDGAISADWRGARKHEGFDGVSGQYPDQSEAVLFVAGYLQFCIRFSRRKNEREPFIKTQTAWSCISTICSAVFQLSWKQSNLQQKWLGGIKTNCKRGDLCTPTSTRKNGKTVNSSTGNSENNTSLHRIFAIGLKQYGKRIDGFSSIRSRKRKCHLEPSRKRDWQVFSIALIAQSLRMENFYQVQSCWEVRTTKLDGD